MRALLASIVLAACGSRAATEPPSNAIAPRAPAGATCADAIIDNTRSIGEAASYLVTTDELIRRSIRDRMASFQLCYLERARYQPDLAGRVTARFTVQKSGRAVNIQTTGFDPQIDQCICAKLSALEFGAFDHAQSFEYAFLFSPGA